MKKVLFTIFGTH